MKPQITVETFVACGACGAGRWAPAHLAVELQREDTWLALSELLLLICDACGNRSAAANATLMFEEAQSADRPRYLLLPIQRTPSSEEIAEGRQFLVDKGLSPVMVASLVPTGWPAADADLHVSVLPALEADPTVTQQAARQERRSRLMAALLRLGAVTSAGQIREALRTCPELATDGVEAERELRSILRWPPEASRLADARDALIRVLESSVTDADFETAYTAFDAERRAAMTQIVQAGYDKVNWLSEHLDAPAADWDSVAAQALELLGFGGDQPGRAMLLRTVGTQVLRRRGATWPQAEWGIQCLRDSRQLWHELDDKDQEAMAGSDLVAALDAWEYGDVYAKVTEAEGVARDVIAYYAGTQRNELLAMAMTNLAVILLRAATLEQRHDRIQEAVDLCRAALPLRPKDKDPYGWAFSAANLALGLRRLGADDVAARRSQLEEAAAVSHEAAAILEGSGDIPAADQARVNRMDALLGLAGELRSERLRTVLGVDETNDAEALASILVTNPGAFGKTETPPEVAQMIHSPAAAEEARILQTVLDEAAAMLAQPRTDRDPLIRSRLARLTAMAWPMLLGPTQEAADALAAARRLIDEAVAPDAAATTSSDLGTLLSDLDRWVDAAAAYDDCIAINDRIIETSVVKDRVNQALKQFPTLARWTAYIHLRCGDPQLAVTILERTRLRSLPRLVPGAGRAVQFLSWRSATLDDIGRAATPTCPIAYVLTAPAGSAVLLVRRTDQGQVSVTVYENTLSSGFFVARMWSLQQPELGFLGAQMLGLAMDPAILSLMEPLGSLLERVVVELLAENVRDLVLVPTGPTAILPWAAAMVRVSSNSQPTPVVDLLNLSVAPSAAAVVLGRERAADRARDAAGGRILVVADPERQDAAPLPGARDEARLIGEAFPGRVDVLEGTEATTGTVLSRLPACWIGHLACHGGNDVLLPEAMRLLLSDADVSLGQLLQLPELRARLVVLSACQTGHVEIMGASDEMLGMPLAFLQAGACAVVSTLWPIDDRVTALLVGRFYDELAAEIGVDGHGDVAAALARAQRWLRSLTHEQAQRLRLQHRIQKPMDPQRSAGTALPGTSARAAPFANPYFWAGLVAYGR
jgi:CHAT domain-containing protein